MGRMEPYLVSPVEGVTIPPWSQPCSPGKRPPSDLHPALLCVADEKPRAGPVHSPTHFSSIPAGGLYLPHGV